MPKILVVEDEKTIADIIAFNLGRENYEVEVAYDGTQGCEKALHPDIDLILLDVMLPGMDGFEICKRVREQSEVPIIMLTAREEEADKVFGLEIGADDYITKPFSMRELTARIRANLRRQAGSEPKTADADLHVGKFDVFFDAHIVKKEGAALDLTAREFDLIRFMCENAGRVVSREELMQKVWGYEYYGDLRAVDVAIRRLREKMEDDPADPRYILTKRGVGYVMSL